MSIEELSKSKLIVQSIDLVSTTEWFDNKLSAIKKVASTASQFMPVLFGISVDDENSKKLNEIILDLSLFMKDERTKNVMMNIIPPWLQQCNIFAICLASESWKKNENHEIIGEMILITQEDLHSGTRILFLNFTRSDDNIIQPSFFEGPKKDGLSGRFVNLLQRAYKNTNKDSYAKMDN